MMAAGLEQDAAERLTGFDPFELGIIGRVENGEDGGLIGDLAILGYQELAVELLLGPHRAIEFLELPALLLELSHFLQHPLMG